MQLRKERHEKVSNNSKVLRAPVLRTEGLGTSAGKQGNRNRKRIRKRAGETTNKTRENWATRGIPSGDLG